ncbi:MAG: hypothetical protein KIT09_14410 [Bryobacteraceae bacterium]|nr:hypothetical protein [Bryobacteraceae bacterium]
MPGRLRLTLLCGAFLCAAQQPSGPRILRPADGSVVDQGPFVAIAKTDGEGSLKLDGQTVKGDVPASGVLTADIDLGPGPHELALSTGGREYKIRFHAGPSPPEGWSPYRSHPPGGDCGACHSAAAGAWSLKDEVAGPACMVCHDAAAFPKTHTHKPAELEECQICHDPHGSAVKGHLIMAKETACKQCHG